MRTLTVCNFTEAEASAWPNTRVVRTDEVRRLKGGDGRGILLLLGRRVWEGSGHVLMRWRIDQAASTGHVD